MVGTTISHFKVLEKIGQGGMGEVYRAEDTNLSREVAIKVLPEQFTQDPQRLARFEREAKLLASLNHPNIAAIHSFEHSDDMYFLVLELVEGETLAERVGKGPLPVEEALEFCRQIAEGVEAAHEKGVIHRDLKPSNVKVTPEGQVKILDFGLAKAFEGEAPVADISQSPTLTEEMTRAGVILGTAAYMSPEQAKGKPVDKGADIFAFGCVLYELLTGRRAFGGETITETLGAIIHKEPDWKILPENTPWNIRTLLQRCLQKDVNERFHHVADVRIEIKAALTEAAAVMPMDVTGAAQPSAGKRAIPWGIAGVAVVVALSLAFWPAPPPESRLSTQFVITPPSTARLISSLGRDVVISPDGRRIAYAAAIRGNPSQLYVRSLDGLEATPITGTEGAGATAFFSPDGESIAFQAEGKLKKVSLSAGPPMTLCETTPTRGGSWGPDDTIVFSGATGSGEGLYRVSAAGGEPETLALLDLEKGETQFRQPEILPGGQALLFTIARGDGSFQIALLSLETGERKIVLEGGRQAHYAPSGHLVYEAAGTGTLMAVPFDLQQLEAMGQPVPILEGVRQSPASSVDYSFSSDGTLVFVPDSFTGVPRRLVWVDRDGRVEPLTETERQFDEPRLSPDGTRLSVTLWDEGSRQIWIYEIARGILTPFTFDSENMAAIWTPDGQRLTFHSHRVEEDISWKPVDGSGEAELLTSSRQAPTSWSLEDVLAYSVSSAAGAPRDIWMLSLEGEREPYEFLATQFDERHAMFSPDGHWVAFTSNQSGQDEIYVKPNLGSGGTIQISPDGGTEPIWGRNGRELFYRSDEKMMVVPVQTEPTLKAEIPNPLFEGTFAYNTRGWASNYDISPDGERFVMVKAGEEAPLTQIQVILNWFEELKRLAPTDN